MEQLKIYNSENAPVLSLLYFIPIVLIVLVLVLVWLSYRKINSLNTKLSLLASKGKQDLVVGASLKAAENTNGKGCNSVILYSADWCGHCKSFLPIWKQIQEQLADTGILLATVDMSNKDVAQKIIETTVLQNSEKILGFPTVLLKNGIDAPVRLNRTADLNPMVSQIKQYFSI